MFAEDIYIAASAMLGEESELLGLLCEAAESELMKKLRADVDVNDIKNLFITAAAMLTCAMHDAATGESAKSWRVGQVSVTGGGSWHDLKDRAESLIADYTDGSGGFEFKGV